MDKNTILGLLLMGVVIFGFSMLNSGDDQSNQPTTEKTEKADAKQATTDYADSLNANELARIKTIVRQYGKQDGDNEAQVQAIENLISNGAEGFLITPSDSKALAARLTSSDSSL